jgi:CO dehydrogenase/acetyl-CoA synthase gamma subunit (corrinoid Fe-S protein)
VLDISQINNLTFFQTENLKSFFPVDKPSLNSQSSHSDIFAHAVKKFVFRAFPLLFLYFEAADLRKTLRCPVAHICRSELF